MKVDFKIPGASQLADALKALPSGQGRISQEAVLAGARVVAAEARRLVPIDTGELRKSIKATRRKTSNENRKAAHASVTGKEGPLAHLIEFGTAAHMIKAVRKKALASTAAGGLYGQVFGRVVRHPGARAKPFLRPAFDTKAGEAVARLGESLGKGIEREAARLAVKVGKL